MTTSKALAEAPALPIGCVDFNKFNDLCVKGDVDAAEKSMVVPAGERAKNQTDVSADLNPVDAPADAKSSADKA